MLAGAGLAAFAASCGGDHQPLEGGTGLGVTIPVAVGRPMTYGQVTIGNESDRPLVIDRVTAKHDDALELLGVRLAGEDRPISIGAARRWPPRALRDTIEPVEGAVLQPIRKGDAGTELLVGLRTRRPGRWRLWELTVHYRQDGEQFEKRMPQEVLICSPYSDPCPLADDDA